MDLTPTLLTIADIYKITLTTDDVAYLTNHDEDISYGGETYLALPIKRDKVNYHINLQVDKVNIAFGLVGVEVEIEVSGILYTIPQVVKNGFLRNAHVLISRIDYIALGTPDTIFEGWVTGDIEFTGGELQMHVGGLLDRLKAPFPTFSYTELCNHQLYGTYCKINRATYVESGTADAGSTQAQVFDAIFLYSNQPLDYWHKGEIKFTSGDNSGIAREIVKHNDGDIKVLMPFPNPVGVGDTFDAWPGCSKTGVVCEDKYNNLVNFGGFEYIPKPEALIYP